MRDLTTADLPGADGSPSMNRREALRRAALLGGAFAAAAPAVQVVTGASAHAMGSPPPPPLHAISFVAFTFSCANLVYKAKWEAGKGWEQLGSNSGGLANCDPIDRWATATPVGGTPASTVPGFGVITASPTPHPDDPSEVGMVTITLPAGCTFNDGSAAVKGGPGGCSSPLVSGQSITFVGNPK